MTTDRCAGPIQVCIAVSLLLWPVGCGVARAWDEPPAAAIQKVHTVAWLVDRKKEWSGWSAIGRRLVLEGRYGFITPGKLRMRGCPLDFVPPKGEKLMRPVSDSRNVEVEGRMADDDGSPIFVVERIITRPSDEDVYRNRHAAVVRTKPEEWYALADWAGARGAFYDDDDLLAKATEARSAGVDAEYKALAVDDAEGLLALAAKVERLKLPGSRADVFRHAGWREKWSALREHEPPATARELATFANELAKALTGTKIVPDDDPAMAAVVRAYGREPKPTYGSANAKQRRRLHRAFHAEVVLAEVLLDLDEAKRNEEAIADRIDERVPEHENLANRLRERALAREVARVSTMTRGEMSSLADRFRRAGDPARAGKVVGDWLAAKEEKLRADGAAGLIEAADYYESLTRDRDKVAALLIEADGLRPDSPEITKRLERLGYTRRGDRWIADAGDVEEAPRRDRPFGVVIGMSPEDVTAVLGTPRAVTRIASDRHLTEVWIYGARGAAGFTIHIVGDTALGTKPGRVVKVSQRRPR